ncbi:hypothetical protein NN561_002980 [Cricetulus griseus]
MRVQGPLGGLLASPADRLLARGLAHSASSAPVAPEGRDKALREAGFGLAWWAPRSTGSGQSSSSGSTFPSSSSQRRCPCCGVSPDTQPLYPLACELLADFGVYPVTFLEVAGSSLPFCPRAWGIQ